MPRAGFSGCSVETGRLATHMKQNQGSLSSLASSLIGGSRHVKWNARSHPSQQSRKPAPPHDEQKSLFSESCDVSVKAKFVVRRNPGSSHGRRIILS